MAANTRETLVTHEPRLGPLVRTEVRGDVAYLSLNAPPLNILTAAMMHELAAAVECAQGNRALKAVAITAAGKVFSAGADVAEHAPESAPQMMEALGRLFRALATLELPLVIAAGGAALGAGFEVVMMGDIVLASDGATFGQPEIRLGFFPPIAVAWLPLRIGPAKAIEVTATGRSYTAGEMQAMGLVSRVVPLEELPGALEEVLDTLRRASPLVMRLNVSAIRARFAGPFEEARLDAERVFLEELMVTEDVREGIASFHEKRRPEWKNR